MKNTHDTAPALAGAGARRGAPRRRTGSDDGAMLATVLVAVGEPNRLRLLRLLLEGERCVTQCTEQTGLVQSLVSKHLGRLVDAGLVQRRKAGRRSYHSVVDADGLRRLLDAGEGLTGAEPLDSAAPRRHVRSG